MLNSDLPDEALMARSAGGDRAAFDALASRYVLRLRRAAFRVLGDAAAAEDVAQDTLLRAWMHAATYNRKQASVGTWLHRIAVNASIDRMRAARPTTELPDSLQDTAEPADLAIAARQRDRLLAQASAALPARQRTAMALTYGEGWSGQEAARALHISTRALEGLLHRGRKLVRAYLEDRDS
jgi:RNA polymerase sigma-70 factor (ECF subfamily)